MKKLKIPNWFKGTVGDENEVVKNPFTKESIELNPLEVAIYDFTMGSNMMAEQLDIKFNKTLNPNDLNPNAQGLWQNVRNGIGWFRKNNAKAYMVLLD
tara:strand:- start:2059 stop:2352 length:294 start_codon:yes stop_codon:yes gene_type:complete